MSEKNFTIETDDDLNAYLVLKCWSCGRAHRNKIGAIEPMPMFTCLCGSLLTISGEDMWQAAQKVDGLKHLIDKLETRKNQYRE